VVVSELVVRASSRPKKTSTSGRATWVESTLSVGSWKLPTLSECEWRSAVEETLGANGSWTWTMSGSALTSKRSIVRLTSSGTGAARGRGPRGKASPEPTASTAGPSPSTRSPFQVRSNSALGRSTASRISRRDSRTAVRDSDGAATRTR
jgi:hypothetical protein